MLAWHIWCACGVILLIMELFTPVLFFLNLALAAFAVAVAAFYGASFLVQTIIFFVLSILLIATIRPLLLAKRSDDNLRQTGIQSKYIGSQAKVIKEVSKTSGRITIYGEEWEARAVYDEVYSVDTLVRIISSENLIMFVEKL